MSWISALLFGPSDDLSDVALNIKRDEPERRVIDTKITRLEEGYRIIGGKYYWPTELRPVRSDRRKEDLVSVGTKVRVKLEKRDETVEWKVVEVEILDEEEEEEVESEGGSLRQLPKFHHVGTVGDVATGSDKTPVSFYMGPHRSEAVVEVSLSALGYEAEPYDLLDVELDDRETEQGFSLLSVKPLRRLDGAGYVDYWDDRRKRGIIDGHITFTLQVCASGRPRKDDAVIFNAVECAATSVNGFCGWRAVKVVREPENLMVCTELAQVVKGRRKRGADVRAGTRFLMRRPKNYEIPAAMWRSGGDLISQNPCLRDALGAANYAARFSVLLHLEEMAEAEQVARYEMRGVALERRGGFLSLEVPGLAEMRPSLLMGDCALVQTSADGYARVFEGPIEEVRSNSILMLFDQRFHDSYGEELCNVRFKLSRGPFKKRHHAVEMAAKFLPGDFLFPSKPSLTLPQVTFPPKIPTNPIKTVKFPSKVLSVGRGGISSSPFVCPVLPLHPLISVGLVSKHSGTPAGRGKNSWIFSMDNKERKKEVDGLRHSTYPSYTPKSVLKKPRQQQPSSSSSSPAGRGVKWFNGALNAEQRRAVVRVLKGEARPMPYVIFGPPGTGKTVTVVEAILQIFAHRSDARICVATPSNSSADLICERLMPHVSVGNMARFNAAQRQEEGIPDTIRDFCYRNEDVDTAIAVLRHRVVVATCNTIGSLLKLNLKNVPFTHAFLDEAGHMMEPEAMIPIGLTSMDGGQIVMAGDPRQLGPVLQSQLAKYHGLEESFLERLTKRESYRRDQSKFKDHCGYDPALVTMLRKNYRSHPAIIKVSSDLFYHSELTAAAGEAIGTTKFVGAGFLPNPDVPVLFHGIKGEQCQEDDSPSWFNPVEAFHAVSYLRKVFDLDSAPVDPEDVGIVTPYRKQVDKIRRLVDALDLERVKVGTVEEFQGGERDVIIISTVKSGGGGGARLGFMSSEKRFNVALTRAKALLIVVGDPDVLCEESCWAAFVEYCRRNGCYTGCDTEELDRNATCT